MRSRSVANPLLIAILAIWGSIFVWWITPNSLLAEWNIYQRSQLTSLFIPAGLATAAFAIGAAMAGRFRGGRVATEIKASIPKVLFWLNALSTMATLLLIGNTVRKAGFGSLALAMGGRIKMEHITGITTLSILSSASCVLAAVALFRGVSAKWQRRLIFGNLIWAWALALTRAIINGERIAVYIPLFATAIAYATIKNFRIKLRHFLLGFVGIVAFFGIYAASETVRSYAVRAARSQTQQTAIEYSRDRLLLYYAMSVNAGGGMFGYVRDGIYERPLFWETCNPLAQIIYSSLGRQIGIRGEVAGADWTIWEGLRIKEFNNIWGVATPFFEGYFVGFAFWLIWGFALTKLYITHGWERGNPLLLSAFAIGMVGLIDSSRVSLLGSSHILVAFIGLLITSGFNRKVKSRTKACANRSPQRSVPLLVPSNRNPSER